MGRRLLVNGEAEVERAAEQTERILHLTAKDRKEALRRKKADDKARTARSIEKARLEIVAMLGDNDFEEAKPFHLVALYEWCHEKVYGVRPLELEKQWLAAAHAASELAKTDFEGELAEVVEFIRWTWRREQQREARRAQSGQSMGRVGWRLQFVTRYLLTDYRIDQKRVRRR